MSDVQGLEMDLGTFITNITPGLAGRLNYGPDALVNLPLSQLLDVGDIEPLRTTLDQLISSGEDYASVSASLKRQDGAVLPVMLTASPRRPATSSLANFADGFTVLVEFTNQPDVPPAVATATPSPVPSSSLPATPLPPPPPASISAPATPEAPSPKPNVTTLPADRRRSDTSAAGSDRRGNQRRRVVIPALPPPPPVSAMLEAGMDTANADLALAYRQIPISAAIVDTSGVVIDSTAAWDHLFGGQPQGYTGTTGNRPLLELALPKQRNQLSDAFTNLVVGSTNTLDQELRCQASLGQIWCRLRGVPLAQANLFHITAEDITSSRSAQRTLASNEALFRSLAETSPMGVARLGPDLVIDYTNPRWRQLTRQASSAVGIQLPRIIHAEDRDRIRSEIAARLASGSEESIRCRLHNPGISDEASGTWVHLRLKPLTDTTRGLIGHVAVLEDITDLMRTQESNSQLAGILKTTSDLVVMIQFPDRSISYLNGAAQQLFAPNGLTSALGMNQIFSEEGLARFTEEVYPVLLRGQPWTGELAMLGKDQAVIQVLQTVSAELDGPGNISLVSTMGRDVTDQLEAHSRLAYQATHDSLTGLPNRSLLIDHMELAMARSARDETPVALLFLDVDKFKYINDTFGHDAGDLMLQELAERLRGVLRPSDTVARLGGDEFVILAEDIEGERDALRIAQRVREAIEGNPFQFGNNSLSISASIGIAISNGGPRDPAALLRDADTAMYRAKQGGRARTELFDEVLRERTLRRQQLTAELAEALDENQLVAHFHPMVDLRSGAIVGAEALARWPHPQRGVVAARDFIDLAADAGLSGAVDQAVVSHAFQQAVRWHQELGVQSPVLHLNASRHSVELDEMADLLQQLLSEGTLPANKLCIEVAESMLNEAGEDLLPRLQRFRSLGLRIAVDGVGATSLPLSELSRYPIDMLKVTPTIISRALDPASQQLVKGIAALARTLSLHIGAEGVDEPNLVGVMSGLKLDAGQGAAFSVPVPARDFEALLRRVYPV